MKFEFMIPTKPKKQAVAKISLFTGSCKLWVEGKPMPYAGKNKKTFTIAQGKKNAKTLRLQPNIFNWGLTIIYGGKHIQVTKPLTVIDYIIGYLPFLLGLFAATYFNSDRIDGIILGVASVFCSLFNMYVIRKAADRKGLATLYNAAVIGGSWGLYYLICLIF